MEPTVAELAQQSKCQACGQSIWLARFFGGSQRAVEVAPTKPGQVVRGSRAHGHITLTFPLPGTGGEIVGGLAKRRTPFRLHEHTAFAAANFDDRRGAR